MHGSKKWDHVIPWGSIDHKGVTAGHMALTTGELDPPEISPTDAYFNLLSVGDPPVITPWLTNHNRDLETSLGLVTPRAGPQVRA